MKNLPKQISAGESFGSSVHNTLNKWSQQIELPLVAAQKSQEQLQMFESGEDANCQLPTAENLIEIWHSSFIVEGYETRLEADFARKRGEQLLTHFFEWWQREPRTVLAVEKGFSVNIGSETISGRIDRIERSADGCIRIIDYKTSAPRTQEEVDADLQLSMYALAASEIFDEPCRELVLLFLREEGVTERETERNEGQLADAAKQLHFLFERIERKEYDPTPSKEKCRFCPYKGVCDVAAK